MNEIVPRKALVRHAVIGTGGIVGGIVLGALNGLAAGGGFSIPGLVVGGIIAGVGLYLGSHKEKMVGKIVLGVGALTLIASLPFVGGLGSLIMSGGGLVLAGAGIYNIVKFFKGLKTRK